VPRIEEGRPDPGRDFVLLAVVDRPEMLDLPPLTAPGTLLPRVLAAVLISSRDSREHAEAAQRGEVAAAVAA